MAAQILLGQPEDKHKQIAELDIKVEELEQQLKEDGKGPDSPCRNESIKRIVGSIRERPLYLLNIKIADEFISAVYLWSTKREN